MATAPDEPATMTQESQMTKQESVIEYKDSVVLLLLNIGVYETTIAEWTGCECQLKKYEQRLADLRTALGYLVKD